MQTTNLTKAEKDIGRLIDEWHILIKIPQKEYGYTFTATLDVDREQLDSKYYSSYTEAIIFIKQVAPHMLDNFIQLHNTINEPLRVQKIYTILLQQKSILEGVKRRFTSSLFDIQHLAQADLFSDALDQARYLCTHKYYRAAGIVAGVVLEQHLKSICNTQGFTIKEKNPSISHYKITLWDENKYITANQSDDLIKFGRLRNDCGHDRVEEPTKDDIQNLINGVDNIRNTIL